MLSPVSDWLVAWCWDALLGVAVAEAAALHNQVVDGKVAGGEVLVGGAKVLGLAGTRLALQQADPDIGEAQLALGGLAKRVQGLPLWEGTVNHLRERGAESNLAVCKALNLVCKTCYLRNYIEITAATLGPRFLVYGQLLAPHLWLCYITLMGVSPNFASQRPSPSRDLQ